MPFAVLLVALASIVLAAAGQILMKLGMSSPSVQAALATPALDAALSVGTNPLVLGGLAAYGASAVIWLYVLSRVEVSVAYPFVSLTLALVLILSALILREPISLTRIAGVALIMIGVLVVGRS